MTTNQNTNPNMGWINQPLQVVLTGSGNSDLGVLITDTLVLSPQNKIVLQHNIPQGVQGPPQAPTEWGTWAATADADTLTGVTSSGQPVTIVHNNHVVTCTLDSITQKPGPFSAIARGAIAGTLAGTVVGFIAGSPALGAVTGLVAGSTGSAVTAYLISTEEARTGPVVTWVANDGGAGRGQKPGPQILKSASA